jgi:hypothetical protein
MYNFIRNESGGVSLLLFNKKQALLFEVKFISLVFPQKNKIKFCSIILFITFT